MSILCSVHQRELYEDIRNDAPMGRWLCPQPGCTAILASSQITAMSDQAWCSASGMTAPGWKTLGG